MKKHIRPLPALILSLALTSLLTACGSAGKSSASEASSADMAYTVGETAAETSAAQEAPAAGGYGAAGADGQVTVSNSAADYAKKIIYSASLQIETTQFDSATAAVDELVSHFGGFVESSNISGDPRYDDDGTTRVVNRRASYSLRIPADQLDSALSQAGAIGNVISTHREAENITSQFTDNEARLDSLQVQEQRLLAMLEKSEDVETLVALEERLGDVRYEIEEIQRTLKNWQMEVDYSTIDLNISEVEVYTPTAAVRRTFLQKIDDALSDGWSGFAHGVQNLAIFIAGALPTLIFLAIVAAAAILIAKKIRRRKNPTASRGEKSDGGSDPPKT